MRYKGYDGRIEVDEASGMLCGSVPGLRDVITFQGRTVEEARRSFEESIDFYLKICDGQGRRPDVPYSGRLVIRTPPEVHRVLAERARHQGKSLNALINEALAAVAAPADESPARPPEPPPGPRSVPRRRNDP